MRKCILTCCAALVLASFAGLLSAGAAPIEADFQLVKITGTCSVRLPGQGAFVDAVEGQKLVYGTTVKTGPDSSAVVRLSAGNGCRISASTVVTLTLDPASEKTVVLKLLDPGYVRVILDKEFRTTNELRVETPSARCEAIHCDFSVEYKIIGDLKTSIISCTEGEIAVVGDCFAMKQFSAGEQVTIAQSPDGKFVRIKIVQGDVTIAVVDSDGVERMLSLNTGDEVQILSEESRDKPGTMVVIYKVDYADPSRKSELIQSEVVRQKGSVGASAGELAPQTDWSLLTVAPLPEIPSTTPVGQRW